MVIKRLQRISFKKQLIGFLSAFLFLMAFQEKSSVFIYKGMIALFAAMLVETGILFIKKKALQFTESSAITGLIVAFVVSVSSSWWIFALASVCSILLKHLIRVRNKHIFNPAALGIFSTVLFTGCYTQWTGAYEWFVIIPFGAYFAYRVKKISLALTYLIGYFGFYGIQSYFKGEDVMSNLYYANYFFILIMLIEPKTSPVKKFPKIVFGIVVCAAAIGLYLLRIPYDAEIPALLIGNLINFLYTQKEKRR